MNRDFEELLTALSEERAEYLVVGGYAVADRRLRASRYSSVASQGMGSTAWPALRISKYR